MVVGALAHLAQVPAVDLAAIDITSEARAAMPDDVAGEYGAVAGPGRRRSAVRGLRRAAVRARSRHPGSQGRMPDQSGIGRSCDRGQVTPPEWPSRGQWLASRSSGPEPRVGTRPAATDDPAPDEVEPAAVAERLLESGLPMPAEREHADARRRPPPLRRGGRRLGPPPDSRAAGGHPAARRHPSDRGVPESGQRDDPGHGLRDPSGFPA